MKQIVILLVLALILSGCGRQAAPTPDPQVVTTPNPTPPAPTPPAPTPTAEPSPSSNLLSQESGIYTFRLQDGLHGQSRSVDEEWARDGARIVATQNGRPYVTWLLRPDGVWRADPKSPKVLLRYLPPDLSEATWRQRSGNEWVYFRLRSESYRAWVLTVLNRGERTEWRFDNGHDVWSEDPDHLPDAFAKSGGGAGARKSLTAERRAAILGSVPISAGEDAAVESIEGAQFVAALSAIPGYERREADLNADGSPESLIGIFARTTWFGPELIDAKSKVLVRPRSYNGAGRYSLVTLGGRPRFLIQTKEALQIYWLMQSDGEWRVGTSVGLGVKTDWTPSTRSVLLPDGRLRVEWEPATDPARHRRVRHLMMAENDQVTWLDSAWEPAESKLRRPTSPMDLLQAFLFAQAYGLQEEAKTYLARPEMASQFPLPDQPKAYYTEPEVQVGRVGANCVPSKSEAPGSGPIPFYAEFGQYEGSVIQHGTAQIGKAPDGRLVIESIEFAKACFLI